MKKYIMPSHLVIFISHNISDLLNFSDEYIVFENDEKIYKYSKENINESLIVRELLEINNEE